MLEIEELKKKLINYKREQICYNEPHFSLRCAQREISKNLIEENLLNPNNLILAYSLEALNEAEEKYEVYFKLSSNRTLKLIIVLRRESLYIITVMVRYRKWQNLIKTPKRHI